MKIDKYITIPKKKQPYISYLELFISISSGILKIPFRNHRNLHIENLWWVWWQHLLYLPTVFDQRYCKDNHSDQLLHSKNPSKEKIKLNYSIKYGKDKRFGTIHSSDGKNHGIFWIHPRCFELPKFAGVNYNYFEYSHKLVHQLENEIFKKSNTTEHYNILDFRQFVDTVNNLSRSIKP